MRSGVTEMHGRGQGTDDEHQLVLRVGAHRPPTWPGRGLGLVPSVPRQAYLSDEFSDHSSRQARDPPVPDDRCTRHVPHDITMIDDQEFDVSCTSSVDG